MGWHTHIPDRRARRWVFCFYGFCCTVFSRATFRLGRTMTPRDKAEHLELLARAVANFEAAREAVEEAVGKALDHDASWSEIGGLLGISRQAAFHRYGPKETRGAQPADER